MTKPVGANGANAFAWGKVDLNVKLSVTDAQLVKNTVSTLDQSAKSAVGTAGQFGQTANVTATAEVSATATLGATDGIVGGVARSIADVFNLVLGGGNGCIPTVPYPGNGTHPSGNLKVGENGVITTPGGYKIEATKQHEWTITGPDGKSTRIWGDPHVDEGDGGKWDFKRDSTFVLGDGTRINVTTKPWGNGDMTVTGGLEIISGNDRVQVTDIDKGKGKVGQVTQDGYQHVNKFGGKDVFVMGKETDDWSFQGKEIIGSHNGGESFKLGNDLPVGTPAQQPTQKPNTRLDQLLEVFRGLSKVFDALKNLTDVLSRRNTHNPEVVPPARREGSWLDQRKGVLERSFAQIGRMLDTLLRLQSLSRGIQANRNVFVA
jgi:hypothetical protein